MFGAKSALLLAAALLPAFFCMSKIYKADKIEKEPRGVLIKCVVLGVFSALFSIILELILSGINEALFNENSILYVLFEAFIIAGYVEETCKYAMLNAGTWNDKNFNYRFDGIVYSAFVSLGFAAIENILYVFENGFSTALMRAVVSIPGHLAFGIIMGTLYGRAKYAAVMGDKKKCKHLERRARWAAILTHGFFDFCLMMDSGWWIFVFIIFDIGLYIYMIKTIKKESREDIPLFSEAAGLFEKVD